jgi:hypothetical protein
MYAKVCPSMLEPQEVEIPSSSGEGVYFVTTPTLYTEGICDPECKGYMYRGWCRHIAKATEDAVCFYGTKDEDATKCRQCGKELVAVVIPNTGS